MKIHNLSEENSIINQFIAELRDVSIHQDSMRFRRNMERTGEIIAYEISKKLCYHIHEIQTPVGVSSVLLCEDKIVLSTILRAGLPFHQGFLNMFDKAESAFISAFRKYKDDHSHFEIITEYMSSPQVENKILILSDPMLATGRSIELAFHGLLRNGMPKHIHLAAAISSMQGIEHVSRIFPEERTTLWTAAIDDGLNEQSYIVPGLGDAGDLAFGEKL